MAVNAMKADLTCKKGDLAPGVCGSRHLPPFSVTNDNARGESRRVSETQSSVLPATNSTTVASS